MLRDFDETTQYSWGNATLAHLYKELCRASLDSAEIIAGPLQLLQLWSWSWERLHVGRPNERLPPNALRSWWRVLLSHIDTPHHVLVTYKDEFDKQRFDQARGDHIITAEPIEPNMDYHALYMTWYHRITCRFITPVNDFRPVRYQATALSSHLLIEAMTSIISQGGQALEDSNSDACCTDIVDIIHMATDVMCIIREDYRIPHVGHGGGRSLAQSIPPTFLSPRLVQSPISSDLPSMQSPISSDLPSVQPPTSSNPSSVQPIVSLDLPLVQPSTSSNSPSVQPLTSLDLLPLQPLLSL
ncbi:hypothetical protein AAG906_035697 [Vitis piasezkii]